ncbi:hypothetical protein APS_0270 [Acetobacter pasteurianus subsp. pasteurianus LMG 1262 = NBRC 106471]|nr:hypothetical protein APS_0270 [Acetobacter pasteurianus subsp. pasteurianus LMG 1262 = NBRC 106471]
MGDEIKKNGVPEMEHRFFYAVTLRAKPGSVWGRIEIKWKM